MKLRIGVSACLLGQAVRYDGTHRYDKYLVDRLGKTFQLMPVCPEVEIGLGVPRPTIRLVQEGHKIRLLGVENPNRDATASMIDYALSYLKEKTIRGLVLKDRSPSCGVGNTDIFNLLGQQVDQGNGLFAQTIIDNCPDIPIVSAEHLKYDSHIENFIDNIIHYAVQCRREH